ncbi:MAG: hypothetical protein ACOCUH_01805, partial [Bacteriovoracia bacterium]
RYLPLGFFYGPQVDIYGGYGRYGYGLDTVAGDGLVESTWKGILLGLAGNTPLTRDFRVNAKIEIIIKPKYGEDVDVHGDENSATSYQLEFGTNYIYNPITTIDGSIRITSNRAQFADSEIHFKDTSLIVGATFSF